MNMFLSDVQITDSAVEQIDITAVSFRITSSTCAFKNVIFNNISQSEGTDLLLVNLDSSFSMDSLNFTNSSSNLLMSRNSNVTISNLYTEDINSDKSIIQISDSEHTKIDNLKISNVHIFNEQSIVVISGSINIQMSNLQVRDINETILSFISSTVDSIDILNVHN